MFHTTVLALVQSIAEFLPISSSAHLILVPRFLGWPDQGLLMDIALHVGTLFSVMLYFRKDVAAMILGGIDILKRKFSGQNARLALNLTVAVIPALAIGFFFHDYIEENFRSPHLIAATSIIFGALLYFGDKIGKTETNIETMTVKDALIIGLAQMFALIPGVSRSGITMTASRFLGVNREEAARFSMLLAVPTIGAAGSAGFLKFFTEASVGNGDPNSYLLIGMLISFVGGVAAISFLMKWLKHSSFAIFAVYRILLGIILFCIF